MRRLLWTTAIMSIALLTSGIARAGDQEVAEEIKYNLKEVLRNYSVGIKVQEGTAWLNGSVADERQMAAALAIAHQTPGVERVVNNMAINASQGSGGRSSYANLRQPNSIATAMRGGIQPVDDYQPNAYQEATNRRRAVVQAGLELPEHAQQELRMGGLNSEPGDDEAMQQNAANRPTYANRGPTPARGYAGRPDASQGYPQGNQGYPQGNAGYPQSNQGYSQANQAYPQGNMGWGPADQNFASANSPGYAQGEPNYMPNNFTPGPSNALAQRTPNMLHQARQSVPLPLASVDSASFHQASAHGGEGEMVGAPQPLPSASPLGPGQPAPYHYDSPHMPGYAWPSYAAYPNYAAVTYPKQYSPTAWPYIGPFYPYPQVPLGWRKVSMEWKDGWWFLDFKDSH
jgi:hypothetical protein